MIRPATEQKKSNRRYNTRKGHLTPTSTLSRPWGPLIGTGGGPPPPRTPYTTDYANSKKHRHITPQIRTPRKSQRKAMVAGAPAEKGALPPPFLLAA